MTKHEAIAIMYGYSQDYLDQLKETASDSPFYRNRIQPDIDQLEQALSVMKGVDDGNTSH